MTILGRFPKKKGFAPGSAQLGCHGTNLTSEDHSPGVAERRVSPPAQEIPELRQFCGCQDIYAVRAKHISFLPWREVIPVAERGAERAQAEGPGAIDKPLAKVPRGKIQQCACTTLEEGSVKLGQTKHNTHSSPGRAWRRAVEGRGRAERVVAGQRSGLPPSTPRPRPKPPPHNPGLAPLPPPCSHSKAQSATTVQPAGGRPWAHRESRMVSPQRGHSSRRGRQSRQHILWRHGSSVTSRGASRQAKHLPALRSTLPLAEGWGRGGKESRFLRR